MYLGSTEKVVVGAASDVANFIEQILVPGRVLIHKLNTVYTWTYYCPLALEMLV